MLQVYLTAFVFVLRQSFFDFVINSYKYIICILCSSLTKIEFDLI